MDQVALHLSNGVVFQLVFELFRGQLDRLLLVVLGLEALGHLKALDCLHGKALKAHLWISLMADLGLMELQRPLEPPQALGLEHVGIVLQLAVLPGQALLHVLLQDLIDDLYGELFPVSLQQSESEVVVAERLLRVQSRAHLEVKLGLVHEAELEHEDTMRESAVEVGWLHLQASMQRLDCIGQVIPDGVDARLNEIIEGISTLLHFLQVTNRKHLDSRSDRIVLLQFVILVYEGCLLLGQQPYPI